MQLDDLHVAGREMQVYAANFPFKSWRLQSYCPQDYRALSGLAASITGNNKQLTIEQVLEVFFTPEAVHLLTEKCLNPFWLAKTIQMLQSDNAGDKIGLVEVQRALASLRNRVHDYLSGNPKDWDETLSDFDKAVLVSTGILLLDIEQRLLVPNPIFQVVY